MKTYGFTILLVNAYRDEKYFAFREILISSLDCIGLRISPANQYYQRSRFPCELDNAGHCPHNELPEIVNPAIADWLKTIE